MDPNRVYPLPETSTDIRTYHLDFLRYFQDYIRGIKNDICSFRTRQSISTDRIISLAFELNRAANSPDQLIDILEESSIEVAQTKCILTRLKSLSDGKKMYAKRQDLHVRELNQMIEREDAINRDHNNIVEEADQNFEMIVIE